MRLLRDDGALSRADLARRSGLAKATVGTIVGQLQQAGAVVEGAIASTGRGRPEHAAAARRPGHWRVSASRSTSGYVAVTALDLAGRELCVRGAAGRRGDGPGLDDVLRLAREEVVARSTRAGSGCSG